MYCFYPYWTTNDTMSQENVDTNQNTDKRRIRHVSAKFLQLTVNGSGPSNQDGGPSRDNRDPSNSKKQEAWVCTLCNLVFNEPKDKILECEVCNSHKCAKCLKLNNSQYTTTQRVDLMWLCNVQCRERASRMLRPSSVEVNNVTTDVMMTWPTSLLMQLLKLWRLLLRHSTNQSSLKKFWQTQQT